MTPPVSSAKRLFRARSSPKDVKHCVTTEARYRMSFTSWPCNQGVYLSTGNLSRSPNIECPQHRPQHAQESDDILSKSMNSNPKAKQEAEDGEAGTNNDCLDR